MKTVQTALKEYEQRQQAAAQQRTDSSTPKSSIPGVQAALDAYYSKNPVDTSGYKPSRISYTTRADRNKTSYVNRFLSDANAFFDTTERTVKGQKYFDATAFFDSQKEQADSLKRRAAIISQYMDENQSFYSPEDYTSIKDYLSTFDTDVDDVLGMLEGYQGKWDSEETYNDFITAQKDFDAKRSLDRDAAAKEIAQMEAELEDYIWNTEYDATSYQERTAYEQGIKDREKQISDKRQYLNQAKRIQEGIDLASVAGNADFATNSGYVSTASKNTFDRMFSDFGLGYDDVVYEYINNTDGVREKIDPIQRGFHAKGYDLLEPEEVAIYNYYYATDGKEKAQEYLDNIQETLNSRRAGALYQNIEGQTARELGFAAATGFNQFESGMQSLFNTEDDYISPSAYQMAAGMVREDLGDVGFTLPEFLGGGSLGQVGFDVISTAANMAPSIMASWAAGMINPALGKVAGTALMGASAAGGAYQEALNSGYTKEQARAYSALVGGSEAGMEYLLGGISALGGKIPETVMKKILSGVDNAFARAAIQLGGNMLSEGFEEGLQEVLTPWFKNLALHADEDINWNEVAYSSLLGALSAGLMESPGAVANTVGTYRTGSELLQAGITPARLAEVGKMLPSDSGAYQLAKRVNENSDTYTVGRLFNEIGEEVNSSGKAMQPYQRILWEMAEKKAAEEKSGGKEAPVSAAESDKTATNGQAGQAADTGKARLISTNAEVDVLDFSEVKNGKATIQLQDEETADMSDVSFATEADAIVFETVAALPGVETETANDMLRELQSKGGTENPSYMRGVHEAYTYGYYGAQRTDVGRPGTFSGDISPELQNLAFDFGRRQRLARAAAEQAMVTAAKKTAPGLATGGMDAQPGKAGKYKKIVFEGNVKKLTGKNKDEIAVMDFMASEFAGTAVHVYRSYKNRNGKYVYKDSTGKVQKAPHGMYVNGEIWVDLNAGDKGEGLVLNTFAHEMYHHIEQWSPEKARALAEFLVQELGMDSVEAAVDRQIAKAEAAGLGVEHFKADGMTETQAENTVYERAMSDFVADALETMFTRGDITEELRRLRQTDKSIFDKLKNFVSKWLKKLESYYKGQTISQEGAEVAQLEKFREIQRMFAEAMADAGENYRAAGEQKSTTPEGDEKYQARPSTKNPALLDPRTVTKSDVHTLLEEVQRGNYPENSYVPVRISTPGIVQERLFAEDLPMAMPVKKILQAFKPDQGVVLGSNIRGHELSVGDLLYIIENMDSPDYLFDQPNGRGVAVLKLPNNKDNTAAIVDFGNNINPAYMNGYEGGKYNISVTAYDIDNGDVGLFMNQIDKKWRKVFDKKTEGDPAKKFQATRPFAIEQDSLNKSVAQGKLKSNPEKYSLRNDGAQKANAALEKENAKLREDVGYLKQLLKIQRSVTGGTKFTRTSVESMAGILMKNNSAKGERKELAALLSPVYEYIAGERELTWEGIVEKAKPAVQWIQEHVAEQKQVNEYANDILREIRTSRVYLDESQQAEAAYQYGSYNDFRKAMMGKITIAKDATQSLDSRWHELAEMYPGVFNADISASEMPGALASIVDSMRDMRYESWYGTELDSFDVLRQIYDGYWRVSTLKTVADVKQKEINRLKYNHRKRMDEMSESHKATVAKLRKEAREDIARIKQQYKERQAQRQSEYVREYRAIREELTGQKKDTAIMEKEFIRLAKQFEQQTARAEKAAGKDAQTIADLRAALKAEAQRHREDQAQWQTEFNRLLREYEASGRKIERMEQTIQRQRANAKARVEGRRRTEMRHKIQSKADELNKLLLKGGKERNVPVGLQKAVATVLDSINMEVRNAEQREKIYLATLARYDRMIAAETNEAIRNDLIEKRAIYEAKGDQFAAKMTALKKAYDEIQNDDDPLMQSAYDEGLSEHLDTLLEKVGDTPLGQMSMEQLQCVYEVLTAVQATVRNANRTLAAEKEQGILELSTDAMREVRTVGGHKKYGMPVVNAIKKFGWNNMKPVYAFETIGSKVLSNLFANVRHGEDTWARDVTEAREFYLDQRKKHGADKWDMEKEYTFTSSSGMQFRLNLEQIMSLYAYAKREQAADHLRRGGIVIDESTEVTVKTKLGIPVKFNPTEATAYNISDDTLGEMILKLTPEQRAFVDEMQRYLSDTMGAKGNEVSVKMYGIKLFKEKNYFPLKSATQFMAKAKEQQQGDVKVKNSGFTKETAPRASNPIVLTPFMDVWARHVDEMSMYHSFVLPLEDFYRVYNYRTATSEEAATQSVQMAIQNAYGKGAADYIDQLLRDLNGGARVDNTTGVINTMLNRFKKGAVFASASVVVQQPSAICRAAALIDRKFFIGPRLNPKRHDAAWAEVKKYAPVAVIKEMGYFDTHVGKSTVDFITGVEYSGIQEKAKAIFTDGEYRDEALSKAPAYADELTWVAIWNAVKRETNAKFPNADTKSEVFLKKCGERFTEVIVKTQVYDSVLSRSGNMRSKDTGMKMATAFMSEPTTSINMVANAILQAKRGGSKAQCRKVIGAVVASQILNSILVSFVYAARDDDEEKTYGEKYFGNLTKEVWDSLNPMGYIPFLRDVQSIAQGYDVERADMSVISDLWKAWESLKSEKVTPWKKVENFVGTVCQLFGFPAKNILRDARSAYQTISNAIGGEDATVYGYGASVYEALTGDTMSDQEQLYNALITGDKDHVKRVRARYEDDEAADSALKSEIRKRFVDSRIDKKDARNYLMSFLKMDVNEVYWTVREWEYAKLNGTTDGYSKYDDLYEAVETGEKMTTVIDRYLHYGVTKAAVKSQLTERFREEYLKMDEAQRSVVKKNLIRAYVQCGETEDDAEYTISKWEFEADYEFRYEDRKSLYLSGDITREQLLKAMVEFGGYSREDADAKITEYEWDSMGYDISAARIAKYQQYCEGAGVDKADFARIVEFSNNTENDVDPVSGKTIYYSAVKKVMAEINRLRIPASQKQAIALSLWKETTVEKYKLW